MNTIIGSDRRSKQMPKIKYFGEWFLILVKEWLQIIISNRSYYVFCYILAQKHWIIKKCAYLLHKKPPSPSLAIIGGTNKYFEDCMLWNHDIKKMDFHLLGFYLITILLKKMWSCHKKNRNILDCLSNWSCFNTSLFSLVQTWRWLVNW